MTNDVKKDIFGDEEDDDDLFKSAIADKVDKIDDLVGGSEITGNLLSPVELGDENSNKVDKNDLLGQVSSDTTENLLGVDLIGSDSSPNSNRVRCQKGFYLAIFSLQFWTLSFVFKRQSKRLSIARWKKKTFLIWYFIKNSF